MANSVLEEWQRIALLIRSACQEICSGTLITIGEYKEPDGWSVKVGDDTIWVTRTFDTHANPMVTVYTVMPLGLHYAECDYTYEGVELAAGIKEVIERMFLDGIIAAACAKVGLYPTHMWRPNKPLVMTFCMRALTFGRWTIIIERRKGGMWNGQLYFDYQEHAPPERQAIMWDTYVVPLASLLSSAQSALIENMTRSAGHVYAKVVNDFARVGINDPDDVNSRVTASARAQLEEERDETQETQGGEE